MIKTRLFEKDIQSWYKNNQALALIVTGPRQVGKTTSIINWSVNNNIKMLTIDLFKEKQFVELINNSKSADELIRIISLTKNHDFSDIDVLFIDEIQVHPDLMYITRLFTNHKIKLICSGSLLGIKLSSNTSRTDVGSKIYLEVSPIDFEEFLIWTNNNLLLDEIKEAYENKRQIHPVVHQQILDLYDKYLILGGMPKVLITYINNNFKITDEIYRIKKSIFNDYLYDNHSIVEISDVFTKTNIKISNLIYERIDEFVIKPNNKRFIISDLNKNYKFRNIMIPLDILKNINIALCSNNVNAIAYPLSHHIKDSSFKLYYSDIGLLTQKLSLNESNIFNWQNNKNISDIMGGVIENSVIINFKKHNLFYWSDKISQKQYEIDLILEDKKTLDIIPFEIKSKVSAHSNSSSLKKYIDKYNPKQIYCIGPNNFAFNDNKIFIPYYAIFLIRDLFN